MENVFPARPFGAGTGKHSLSSGGEANKNKDAHELIPTISPTKSSHPPEGLVSSGSAFDRVSQKQMGEASRESKFELVE